MDNFGTGGLRWEATQRKEERAAVETAAPPHPRASRNRSCSSLLLFILTLRAWIRAFSSVPRGSGPEPGLSRDRQAPQAAAQLLNWLEKWQPIRQRCCSQAGPQSSSGRSVPRLPSVPSPSTSIPGTRPQLPRSLLTARRCTCLSGGTFPARACGPGLQQGRRHGPSGPGRGCAVCPRLGRDAARTVSRRLSMMCCTSVSCLLRLPAGLSGWLSW